MSLVMNIGTVIERFLDVRFDTRLEVSRAGNAWRVDVLPGGTGRG